MFSFLVGGVLRKALSTLFALFFGLHFLFSQDTVQATWAGTLSGSEVGSVQITAGCTLESFDISLAIVAPGSNWAGDMALAITAPNGNRIEVGGYNTGFGYVDAGGWPSG